MLIIKSFHIIAMVAWFSGLFYLPRLFVYHASTKDILGLERFKTMERRLYYGITWPSALITTTLGLILISYNFPYYLKALWLHVKLGLVILVWGYHLICGHFLRQFAKDNNRNSSTFYRIFNELSVFLLIGIVFMVVLKPG